MLSALLLAASLLAPPPPSSHPTSTPTPEAPAAKAVTASDAPRGRILIETKRGKLEFDHQAHSKVACAACHKGQGVPARIGIKGKDAAHKFCLACHRAQKKGPQKCTSCHDR